MKVKYSMWESDDGLMKMIEFEPESFKNHVSTEVKDRAKERGLVYFDEDDWKIVLTDDPDEYKELIEIFGLEDYLIKRVEGVI